MPIEDVNFRSLLIVIVIVFGLSAWWGYWRSLSPYQALVLSDLGYTPREIGEILAAQNILVTVTSFGGSFMLLVASYYSGKSYRLTGISTLMLLIFLLVTIFMGNLLGYTIRQQEFPKYPILNVNFIFDTISTLNTRIVWTFLGVLAGNYRRELNKKDL